MKRSKLQKMVQAAVSAENASTEGFLGSLIDGIKSLFKEKKVEIFKPGEEKTNSVHFHKFVDRLNKTVLNPAWLDQCTFSTADIKGSWAIPGLDYQGKLDISNPLKHLELAVNDFHKQVKLHLSNIEKYSKEGKAIYAELVKDLGKCDGSKNAISACFDKAEAAYSKITKMPEYLSKHPYEFIGNNKYIFSAEKNPNGYTQLKTKKVSDQPSSKYDHLPALTKDQVCSLAAIIVKLIADDPYDAISDAQDYINWDALERDVVDAGFPSEELDTFMNACEQSVFLTEFSVEHGFDGDGVKELLEVFDVLVIRPLQWINASVKCKE